MFKIVKAMIALFAILGVIGLFAIGSKAYSVLSSYSDNLSNYSSMLREMSDENEKTVDDYVIVVMA